MIRCYGMALSLRKHIAATIPICFNLLKATSLIVSKDSYKSMQISFLTIILKQMLVGMNNALLLNDLEFT